MNRNRIRPPAQFLLAAAVVMLGVLGLSTAAQADSPRVDVFNGGINRCAANWYSGPDQFGIADMSADGHYCYIQYDWDSNVDSGGSRISHGKDQSVGTQFRYGISTSGHSTVYWKLCREVSGTDNCTSVRSDAV